jgi:formate dehydrogenase major subunit
MWGTIDVQKPIFKTNRPTVFAGGDVVKGPSIVVDAVYQGRKAAEAINCLLAGETYPTTPEEIVSTRRSVDEKLFEDEPKMERIEPEFLDASIRAANFNEVDTGLTEEQAVKEAERCLSCGCQDLYECKLKNYMDEYLVDPRRFSGRNHDYNVDKSHPFILREPNKCIKCGKCVEVCDSARGISVFGFAHRGFDAVISPTLNKPLIETDCISCGDCVALCPVGALTEKVPFRKAGPYRTVDTPSTCTRCSLGCHIVVQELNGSMYKITPNEKGWNGPHMCETGRFDYSWVNDARRMVKPRMKVGDITQEVDWDSALSVIAKELMEEPQIILRPTCTNEEAYIAREIVRKLNGDIYLIVDDHATCDGLQKVLGNAGSTISFDEIHKQDIIMVYNTDLINRSSVAGVKIRQASREGKKVIVVGGKPHGIRNAEIMEKADIYFLEALIAVAAREQLITGTAYDEVKIGIQPLLKDLAVLSKEAIEERGGRSYEDLRDLVRTLASDRGLIVFGLVNSEEAVRLALFKQITDANMIVLKRGSNSQGIADLDIPRITLKELESLSRKNILMLGYPPENFVRPKSCKFLAIQRTTDPFPSAAVVIPRSTNYENDGTSLTTDRRLIKVSQSIGGRKQNWKILADLADRLDIGLEFPDVDSITSALLPELRLNRDDRRI